MWWRVWLRQFRPVERVRPQQPQALRQRGFWGLIATSFLFGSYLSDWQNGMLVLALIVLGGFGLLGHGKPETTTAEERRESAHAARQLAFRTGAAGTRHRAVSARCS